MAMPRLVLALTVLSVVFTILLVARVRGERVFFMDLGRPLEASDRSGARRVQGITVASGVVGVLAALAGPIGWATALATLMPFVSVTALLVEVTRVVRSASQAPNAPRFRVPLSARPPVSAYVSLPLQIAHLALLVLTPAAFWLIRSELPASVPLHFDAAGRANRWGSADELWVLGGVMLFVYSLLWVIVRATAGERWALPEKNAEAYAKASRRRRELLVRMVECLLFSVNACMALSWLAVAYGSLPGNQGVLGLGITLSIVVSSLGTLGSIAFFLSPLSEVQDELTKLGGVALGTRPDGWRLRGMIYYAPDDPALWIPKRYGIGQTLNFARPGAWIFLGFTLLVPIGIAVVASVLAAR